jgi:ATP-dependent Clp protease ATP-binding subunit ClpB
MKMMSNNFRPEFLARITEIIPFAPITEEIAENIFKIQLKSLHNSLYRLGIELKISDVAIKYLAVNGFSSQYGARQIGGVIRTQLARPISKKIVSEEIKNGHTVTVDFNTEDQTLIWNIEN